MSRAHKLFFMLGMPLSPLYSAAMQIRSFFYKVGVFKQHRLSVPVVSVGNLTLGGTGKTPIVIYLAKVLVDCGLKPVIVSRGYGGKASGVVNVVSNGHEILMNAREAGDEPRLIAESLPGVPVLTGKKRPLVGEYAVRKFQADIIVLDDGFQHLALYRDFDIVLFNAQSLLGNARVFPGGELREPLSALNRAGVFLITGARPDLQENIEEFTDFLNNLFPEIQVFKASYQLKSILKEGSAESVDMEHVKKIKLLGFCGLAKPDSFKFLLLQEGVQLVDFVSFKDHQSYTQRDIERVMLLARERNADGFIVTEKDFVKLKGISCDLPLYALRVEMEPDEKFTGCVKKRLC